MENDVKLLKLSNCSGCAAKVGAGTLAKLLNDIPVRHEPNLIVGFDRSDDACVYRVDDKRAVVQTVDFFPAVADDPFTFGQIAAANALSDIYAMGGEPAFALNLLCIPKLLPQSAVHAILAGGLSKVSEAGAVIAGGHSIYDDVPKYGLCVTGFVNLDSILTNSGAKPNDVLILTKPLGVGILSTAAKGDLVDAASLNKVYSTMSTLNRSARDIMVKYRVHACTDVTGFGLLGHLYEMMVGSQTYADIRVSNISFMDGALEYAKLGLLPEGMYRNRAYVENEVLFDDSLSLEYIDALFDPQTSGGLLIAVDPRDADRMLSELASAVPAAQRIGTVTACGKKRICVS